MPLQGLRLLHVELVGALLVVQIAHVCLRLLELLLLVVLHLITMVRGLSIQSTFRFDSIYCALVAHHTLTLLLVNWDWWIGPRLVNSCVWNNSLHFHHSVELLASLLELFFVGRVVRVGTNRAHGIRASFWSDHGTQSTDHACLIFDFDMDRIVGVNWASIRHWSLRASSSLIAHTVHLTSRLKNLLTSGSATAIHGVVHHTGFVELTIGLAVKWITLNILTIHGLRTTTARSLKVLTLGSSVSVSIRWSLVVGDNATTDHSESTWVFALSGHLLNALVLPWHGIRACRSLTSRWQCNDTSCRLHRTHS